MTPDETIRFRLTLHYDGSDFLGWQIQPRGRTVQGVVEQALERLTGARRPVLAAGRTDTGVHATGQVAAVTLPSRWIPGELHRALNALLPEDVWVQEVRVARPDFHPRHDARGRSYRYRVGLSPASRSPFHRRWCWPLARPLDPDLLAASTALLEGEHSFRAFAKSGQEERGDRCRVERARWHPWEELGVAFHVTADRFLHHMVRYLVGTMVEVARGRRPVADLAELLTDPGTSLLTSRPAPPQGLFLTGVHYPGDDSRLD